MRLIRGLTIFVLAATLLLAGCSSRQAGKDIRPADAAEAILEKVAFTDSLQEAQGEVAGIYYELDDKVADYAIYIAGSGATAEEVAVLKAASKADTAHVEEIVGNRLQTLKDMFENYQPGEMVKLGNPVIETRDDIVYFVCADDPQQAKEAIASLYQ